MLAIEVEYLLGRAVATDPSQRDRAEWPPHPSRLFSALVDALSDLSDEGEHNRGEVALRWLEAQPPPDIAVSLDGDVSHRNVVKYFVPINDEPVDPKKARPTLLTELRTRQERFFPAVVPSEPRVTFAWPESDPMPEHATALHDLAARVPYLGHSSSLVRVACKGVAPESALAPALAGPYLLRVPGPGRLDRLNAIHEARRTDTYVQPPKGREVHYAPLLSVKEVRGPYGAVRVLAFDGARFGLEETAWVTERFRAAFISKLPGGKLAPEILTGHGEDGGASSRAHVAFTPLANVDGRSPDGSIKGLAVLLPRDADERALILLDTALSRISSLFFGARGKIDVRPLLLEAEDGRGRKGRLHSLDAHRYSRASTIWVTVTPIALGLHPKPNKGLTEEAIVTRDLRELGLPEPVSLVLSHVSDVRGAPPARSFHRGELSALRGRLLRHAAVRFAQPVAGPLVVGAGRHMGFGLLMPRDGAP